MNLKRIGYEDANLIGLRHVKVQVRCSGHSSEPKDSTKSC